MEFERKLLVLIADDEPIIREGLAEDVNWQSFGMEVLHVVADGELALEAIAKQMPDICLLDICMPFEDGLSVAEKFYLANPVGEVLFVSGHDEFEFTSEAIRINAHKYILKPIDFDVLTDSLYSVAKKVRRNIAEQQELNILLKQLALNMDLLKKSMLNKWTEGALDDDELKDCLSFHKSEIPNCATFFLVKLKHEHMRDVSENEAQKQLLMLNIEKIIHEQLKNIGILECWQDNNGYFLGIAADINESFEKTHARLQEAISKKLNVDVTIFYKELLDLTQNAQSLNQAYGSILLELRQTAKTLPIVSNLLDYVKLNYTNPDFKLADFAQQSYISKGYLSKLFKQETGQCFVQYLLHYRIVRSLEHLKDSNNKIYDVAELVGFNSQHYYCEIFSKIMGLSPSEYKKQLEH